MKPFIGKASVSWDGGHQHGRGAINADGVPAPLPYGFGRQAKRNATHPSELIAAAHAGSFSMTLAEELDAFGYPVARIDTAATITMEYIAARWTMTRIHLEVIATVRDGEEFDFVDATLRAKANCPVSRLLNANISMQARLKRGLVTARPPTVKVAKRFVPAPASGAKELKKNERRKQPHRVRRGGRTTA